MKIGILGGLAQWSTHQLMLRLRSLFAFSVGCFLLMLSVLVHPDMARAVTAHEENGNGSQRMIFIANAWRSEASGDSIPLQRGCIVGTVLGGSSL